MELSQVAATYDDTLDELVLGDSEAEAADHAPAVANADPAPAPEAPARSSVGGGTLFEPMSRLSRGGEATAAEMGGEDAICDIPRFLGRPTTPIHRKNVV